MKEQHKYAGVYEKLKVLEEILETIEEELNRNSPGTNSVINDFGVSFYEEETEDGKTEGYVGIIFKFSEDTDITPSLSIFEGIKEKTGCDDIFLNVGGSGLVDSIELFYKQEATE